MAVPNQSIAREAGIYTRTHRAREREKVRIYKNDIIEKEIAREGQRVLYTTKCVYKLEREKLPESEYLYSAARQLITRRERASVRAL